jgi:hypothetical protein
VSENADSFGLRGYILFARDGEIYEVGLNPGHALAPKEGEVLQVPIREGKLDFGAIGFELGRELDVQALEERVLKATTATASYSDNTHDKSEERAKASDIETPYGNGTATPMVETDMKGMLYILKSGRIVGDILEQDDGHGNPRYKWRINRPYTLGMEKLSSTFAPEDIPHAKEVLGKIEQIFKEELGHNITSEVKVTGKEDLKLRRKQSL